MEVDGITVAKATQIENSVVVSGVVNASGYLVLTTKGGTTINAGQDREPAYLSWPVGSIFMNIQGTDPSILLGGGTWVRWGKGRMPISLDESDTMFDTVEETGGEKTHVLTVAEMPRHAHGVNTGTESVTHTHSGYSNDPGNHQHSNPAHTHSDVNGGSNNLKWNFNVYASGGLAGVYSSGTASVSAGPDGATTSGAAGSHTHTVVTYSESANHTHAISYEGGGAAANNLPPFISVYMWKRTA